MNNKSIRWITRSGSVALVTGALLVFMGLAPFATAALTAADLGAYVTVDVTTVVKGWVEDPAANHGIAILPTGFIKAELDSKENKGTSNPMELEVAQVRPREREPLGLTQKRRQGLRGPPGPQGPPGPRGPQGTGYFSGMEKRLGKSVTVTKGRYATSQASCRSGWRVMGGGYTVDKGGGGGFTIRYSRPRGEVGKRPMSWEVRGQILHPHTKKDAVIPGHEHPMLIETRFHAVAVCAKVAR